MKYEIGPIVEEDKNPHEIRRALSAGAGGVLVDQPVPLSVQQEWQAALTNKNNVLFRAAETPPVLEVVDRAGHVRWTYKAEGFAETQRWLCEEFAWAASSSLCRSPLNPQGHNGFVRLWVNQGQHLPWHIDTLGSRLSPDVHIHIGGAGMKLASPRKPMEFLFSDNKRSPYLQLPNPTLIETGARDYYEAMQRRLKLYLRERDVAVSQMQPGQILFFNEKCLHASAGANKPRIRAGIF